MPLGCLSTSSPTRGSSLRAGPRATEIPHAKSVVDYIFRWLGIEFIPGYREANTPQRTAENGAAETKASENKAADPSASTLSTAAPPKSAAVHTNGNGNGHGGNGNGNGKGRHASLETELEATGPAIRSQQFANFQTDAPACDNCGAITVRNGNCYLCHNCGNSMGCS